MIPNTFDYHRATSVDEAIRLMAQHGMDAKLLAGGHSLLPAMKLRLNQPGVLVDIGRLAELRYIKKEGNGLSSAPAPLTMILPTLKWPAVRLACFRKRPT